MNVEYLIVGQGLCGTWLSWFLQKENRSFLVFDTIKENSPSRISAGIINPVTGRRLVTVWLADQILPFAWKAYREIGEHLQTELIFQKNLIDFFPNPHQRQVFLERISENDEWMHSYPEQNEFNPYFNYELGCGEIRHCYTVDLEGLLSGWRKELKDKDRLIEEEFLVTKLEAASGKVKYKELIAEKIIFCDGLESVSNPFFEQLPFAPNGGGAVTRRISDL